MTAPERVELFVDEHAAPAQVLAAPPFDLALDTTALADGEHTLRVVTRFADGRSVEERVGIVVRNRREPLPPVVLGGLSHGDEVSGVLRATVRVQPRPAPRGRRWAYLTTSVVVAAVFAGVWAVFALASLWMPGRAAPGGPAGQAPSAAGASAAIAPSAGAVAAGAKQFQTLGCAGCHTIAGTAAAGTVGPNLTHIGAQMTRPALQTMITHGQDGMPGFGTLAAADLNALLDYLQTLK